MDANNKPISPMSEALVNYKEIPGFAGYRVGDDGSVWSRRRQGRGGLRDAWKLMTPSDCGGGKLQVKIAGKRFFVHRLVLLAFVGPCPNDMECCHFPDRNPSNNRLSNLRWGTRQDNAADQVRHGTRIQGERHPKSVLTDRQVASIRQEYSPRNVSLGMLAKKYNVSRACITNIISGKRRASAASASGATPSPRAGG